MKMKMKTNTKTKTKLTIGPEKIRTIILDALVGSSFGLRRDLSRIVSMELSERGIVSLRKALEKIEKLQRSRRKRPTTKGGHRA